jgi:two-component system, NarL family, nitrate/nitrite response regulator NarL
MSLRLMLVDDHPLVRDGLRARLEAAGGLAVVAEAGSADEALQQAALHRPDLVLMDVGMRGTNGLQATRALRAQQPDCRVLVLSMYDHAEYVREAERAGAAGYVLKDSPAEEIVRAIHAVAAGGRYFAPSLPSRPGPATEADPAGVTPREREVLTLIAQGLSSKDIGERLGMGVRTVETHRTNLRRKLNLASPAALVLYAKEHAAPPDKPSSAA